MQRKTIKKKNKEIQLLKLKLKTIEEILNQAKEMLTDNQLIKLIG